jgi:hypothetical protein
MATLQLMTVAFIKFAVLCIVPAKRAAYPMDDETKENHPEPELYILEGESEGDIATGRHRTDGKYK